MYLGEDIAHTVILYAILVEIMLTLNDFDTLSEKSQKLN